MKIHGGVYPVADLVEGAVVAEIDGPSQSVSPSTTVVAHV
jgi:hypothetical protein